MLGHVDLFIRHENRNTQSLCKTWVEALPMLSAEWFRLQKDPG